MEAELFYVREGVINDYALNFVVPVPSKIDSLHFTWESLTGKPVSYTHQPISHFHTQLFTEFVPTTPSINFMHETLRTNYVLLTAPSIKYTHETSRTNYDLRKIRLSFSRAFVAFAHNMMNDVL